MYEQNINVKNSIAIIMKTATQAGRASEHTKEEKNYSNCCCKKIKIKKTHV